MNNNNLNSEESINKTADEWLKDGERLSGLAADVLDKTFRRYAKKERTIRMENKPGESTPEEYINEMAVNVNHNGMNVDVVNKHVAFEAIKRGRKSERERVLDQAIEKVKEYIKRYGYGEQFWGHEYIEILNNLKKEKGE
jgi:hypothetical protein